MQPWKTPESLERIEEMKRLRFEEKWTLRQIGEKYGITRERVRQLIGNTGHMLNKEKPVLEIPQI